MVIFHSYVSLPEGNLVGVKDAGIEAGCFPGFAVFTFPSSNFGNSRPHETLADIRHPIFFLKGSI
jgi:hypothetical protein